jgi:hypothetical protein
MKPVPSYKQLRDLNMDERDRLAVLSVIWSFIWRHNRYRAGRRLMSLSRRRALIAREIRQLRTPDYLPRPENREPLADRSKSAP